MMMKTKQQILEGLISSFYEDYDKMDHENSGRSVEEFTVSVEEFRKAGIDAINELYGKNS